MTEYDPTEQDVLQDVFGMMLRDSTRDGGVKRAAGLKEPWWRDQEHLPAIFSHLNRRFHDELIDPDSGSHPFVHMAWRGIAIAYQETYGQVDPLEHPLWIPRLERL
jgi:hypothetical protein